MRWILLTYSRRWIYPFSVTLILLDSVTLILLKFTRVSIMANSADSLLEFHSTVLTNSSMKIKQVTQSDLRRACKPLISLSRPLLIVFPNIPTSTLCLHASASFKLTQFIRNTRDHNRNIVRSVTHNPLPPPLLPLPLRRLNSDCWWLSSRFHPRPPSSPSSLWSWNVLFYDVGFLSSTVPES